MRLEGNVLHVKSAPEWYREEYTGRKPYTLRLVDDDEYDMVADAETVRVTRTTPDKDGLTLWFERPIADVENLTGAVEYLLDANLGDKKLLLISFGEGA